MTPALTTDTEACPEPGAPDVAPAAVARRLSSRRRWLYVGAGIGTLLIITAAVITVADIEAAAGSSLLRLVRVIGQDLLHLRWQFTAIVIALAALHYVVTAIAARAVAGIPLPMGETVLVQLAAAAANRLTPAGLGGAAVNARYFSRRGLTLPVALGAVASLSVLGSLSDLIVLALIVLLGRWIWLDGASNQVGELISKVTDLTSPLRSIWTWFGVVVLIVLIAALIVLRSRRGAGWPKWQTFWSPLERLARRPRALATLLLATGCTTLILAFAFVATTAMVPGPRPDVGLGALLVAFMLGSAAGSAVPIPAGLGSTETALVGVLVAMDVPSSHAVQEVLIFRLLTFWLPAVVGVLATRYLHRRGAL